MLLNFLIYLSSLLHLSSSLYITAQLDTKSSMRTISAKKMTNRTNSFTPIPQKQRIKQNIN